MTCVFLAILDHEYWPEQLSLTQERQPGRLLSVPALYTVESMGTLVVEYPQNTVVISQCEEIPLSGSDGRKKEVPCMPLKIDVREWRPREDVRLAASEV